MTDYMIIPLVFSALAIVFALVLALTERRRQIDKLGKQFGVSRWPGETDDQYYERIKIRATLARRIERIRHGGNDANQ